MRWSIFLACPSSGSTSKCSAVLFIQGKLQSLGAVQKPAERGIVESSIFAARFVEYRLVDRRVGKWSDVFLPMISPKMILSALTFLLAAVGQTSELAKAEVPNLRAVSLKSVVQSVQPMSGIVLWDSSPHRESAAIQLEFSYLGYGSLVAEDSSYDWSLVEEKLAAIASRGHQAIFRFFFTYPGRPAEVPKSVASLPDYEPISGTSEGKETGFPNWSHPALGVFVKDFHTAFAARYDGDPRLAFVQVGFGLWGEYHIYDGPFELGRTFPDRAFQGEFLRHLAETYLATPWSVSVDSAKESVSPFLEDPSLLDLDFGIFDDSFLCEEHGRVNVKDWETLGRDRILRAPAGGEFSYYTDHEQQNALAPKGPHGESFEAAAARLGISYIIGNDQPEFQSLERIHEAGMACGYRFRIVSFESGPGRSRVGVRNEGVAPLYHDAYVAVDGVRAERSLKGLAPGAEGVYEIAAGGEAPRLEIECDRLSPGQRIEFEADLEEAPKEPASGVSADEDGEVAEKNVALVPLVFQLTGGIGLFLMGMVLLTDGVKAYAGDSLRRALMRFTGTPGKAFVSGALVTTLVQSSSATTVAVIGFVSAGLIGFSQALGVVFGASLGTTATGWIIAGLGLKVSVGFYALPLVGLGAFFRLLGRGRMRSLGTALAGFGIIFIGIETLQIAMRGLSGVFDLAALPSAGAKAHLLAMLIGTGMTVIMQSSSAAVATILTALHAGAVNFDQAASVVIGAAVGTTVTGVVAAIGASVPARRTALAHVLFNLATGLIAVLLLPVFLWLIAQAQAHLGLDPGAMSLAAFHTAFIAVGVAIFLPMVDRFGRVIERFLPDRGPVLTRHLDKAVLRAPSVALEASRRALADTAAETCRTLAESFGAASEEDAPKVSNVQLREALDRIQQFLPQIPPVVADEPLSELRLRQLHAIDHLERLQSKLEFAAGKKDSTAGSLLPAKELVHEILTMGKTILRGGGESEGIDAGDIEAKAAVLAEWRRNRRPFIMERRAASGDDPAAVLDELDALRWIDAIGFHTSRLCHYLAPIDEKGSQEGSGELASPGEVEQVEG